MNGKKNKPSVICIGSNIESYHALKGLLSIQANIIGLITRPPGNPGSVCDYYDLHELCRKHNIVTIDTLNINSEETLKEIQNLKPDYIFTLGWSQLFREKLLSIPKKYTIGSHPSSLPHGRGRAPVPWTILENLSESAVSFFIMNTGIDSGELLLQKSFKIPQKSYAYDVYMLVATTLTEGFQEIYKMICNTTLKILPNQNKQASYRSKRIPGDGRIDFNKPSEEICRLIRAVSYPYPGAYSYYDDRKYRFWKCSDEQNLEYSALPGQILEIRNNKLLVFAKDITFWIEEITDQFNNAVNPDQFRVGKKFGYNLEDEIYNIKKRLDKLSKDTNE